MQKIDVAIIGAGSAGLSARAEVAKHTDSYRVFDRGPLGTTCARVGCMPSKAFIHSANAFHRRKSFSKLGIAGAERLSVDTRAVMQEMRALRDDFVAAVLRGIDDWRDPHLIEAEVRFADDGSLEAAGQRFQASRTIIAIGTSPRVPQAWRDSFGDRIIDTDAFFELEKLPASMAVIGLGPIGLELGQALARLGVDIIGFDDSRSLGGLSDPDLQNIAIQHLSEEFQIVIDKVELESDGNEKIRVTWSEGAKSVDAVLVAIGRQPNLGALNLDAQGIELDERGLPPFDQHTYRIADSNLYIVGDANKLRPVLHEASDEGRMAGYNATQAADTEFDRRVTMLITFSDPQVAQVGESFAELMDRQADFVTGSVSFDNQGRARVSRDRGGCLRIHAQKKDGRFLGCEMFTPQAEHFAHTLACSLEHRATVSQMLRMPFYHPVYEEGLRTALRDAVSQTDVKDNEIALLRCLDPVVEEGSPRGDHS